jgi:chaperone modulatory protein CbpM
VKEHFEALWIEKRERIGVDALARISGLSEAEVTALVEYGALSPVDPDDATPMFAQTCVTSVKTAGRLRQAFDLEPDALALTLSLIERIHDLQDELRRLRVTMPHRSS